MTAPKRAAAAKDKTRARSRTNPVGQAIGVSSPASDAALIARVPILPAQGMQARHVMALQRRVGNRGVQRLLAGRSVGSSAALKSVVQRYEAGEHAKFGEVESLIGPEEASYTVYPPPSTYVVAKGDVPAKIASRFGVSPEFLVARNASLYRTWTSTAGKKVRGFNAGDVVTIPGKTVGELSAELGIPEATISSKNATLLKTWKVPGTKREFRGFDRGVALVVPTGKSAVTGGAKTTTPTKPKTITINGVKLSYGEVIALGDLFETPEDMYKADAAQLADLAKLIRKEAGGKAVTTGEWQTASKGRYLVLAENNISHFAPPDPKLADVTVSAAGVNHKTEWEKHHRAALKLAKEGKEEKALGFNAFADHFLTDAFSAGHLFNKKDVMAKFDKAMAIKAVRVKFFDEVAKAAWADPKVSGLLSKYEATAWHGADINSASRFSSLLQAIFDDPSGTSTVLNTAAKIVHDSLNKSGVEVENNKGDKWTLSGDGTLDKTSLEIGRKAVAQSQVNILNTAGEKGKLDEATLFKKVWDYVPHPSATGEKLIHKVIETLTDPSKSGTVNDAAEIIKNQTDEIVKELVKRKKLQPKGWW